ncbi:hypothetical protein Tco_0025145 [Tanacetum coccineum]
MSAFNLNEPIYSTSFIIHSEFALGNDASTATTAEADPGNSTPSDFVPQQQGINEGTKNTSYDYLFIGTDPHVLADQTKSVSEGLETVLTHPIIRKGASSVASQIKEETSSTIKLEDLTKLVSHVQPSFKDLDSPKDDPVIVVNDSDDEVHAIENSQKYKLELEKNKAEAEVALLKAQPSFLNVEQLKELLVKSLKTEFSNILSAHDFISSLPAELKDLCSKFKNLTKETVTSLTSQVPELKTLQWELPAEFLAVPSQVEMFAQTITSKKTGGDSVPLAGQAGTQPAEGEKNTNQATISHPPKGSSQTEGEHIKKDKPEGEQTKIDKGKKAMSSKDAKEESTKSDYDDKTIHVPGSTVESYLSRSMVESSRIKKVKKFDFVTEDGKHIHLTEEQINQQKKIEDEDKAEAAERESEVRKEELIYLLSPEVVNKKGPITYKVYKEDGTSENIPNFKVNDMHLGEWREVMKACPNRTRKGWEPIYKQIGTRMDYIHTTKAELGMVLFNSYHRHDFVTIKDFRDFLDTMFYTIQEIFFRLHQGPRLDDHARTFSSLLLAKIDKRNLNPLKQMRVIEHLRR